MKEKHNSSELNLSMKWENSTPISAILAPQVFFGHSLKIKQLTALAKEIFV